MSFLFSFIPNIGFILALIPPTLFALLEHGPRTGDRSSSSATS